MNAIIYPRVSTTDQAESGAGLTAQSASCAAFAAKAGMNVIWACSPTPGSAVRPASRIVPVSWPQSPVCGAATFS